MKGRSHWWVIVWSRHAPQAGERLPVTLYWRSARPITAFYQLALNAFGYEAENVAKLDTWPGGGLRPTAYWQPGVL